jgi:hypothetical protein
MLWGGYLGSWMMGYPDSKWLSISS